MRGSGSGGTRFATAYPAAGYPTTEQLTRILQYFLELDDWHFGWRDLILPNLEVCCLPFYPKGMLVEPFVRTLACELDRYLVADGEEPPAEGTDAAFTHQTMLHASNH